MTTWIIDVRDKVGQRVQPFADVPSDAYRFRKVVADTFTEALKMDQAEVFALASHKEDRHVCRC